MKISRKKSFFTRKRIIIIVSTVVALVIAAGLYWWFYMRATPVSTSATPRPANSVDYGPATAQDQQDSASAKQNDVNSQSQGDTNTPVTSDSLVVTINRAGQANAGQSVAVRTQIDGTTSGTCTATFTKSGQSTVTKTFTVATTTITACNGDVDASQFGTSGDWQLSVTVQSGNIVSKPATQTVTIQK